jgi:hypothetical protein
MSDRLLRSLDCRNVDSSFKFREESFRLHDIIWGKVVVERKDGSERLTSFVNVPFVKGKLACVKGTGRGHCLDIDSQTIRRVLYQTFKLCR